MKRAIVLGASGSMGYSIVKELANRGIDVIAFARHQDRLENMFSHVDYVRTHPGDLLQLDELRSAVQYVDVVFHAVGVPYQDWEAKLPLLTNNIISVVKEFSLKLAVVDNIYAYGKNPGYPITENTPKIPHTKKGKIRLAMENRIKESGIPYIIAHFPDFYGPFVENGLINYTIRQILEGKRAYFIGKQTIPREYIYTPDGAKAIVELASHEKSYGENWNIPGFGLITGKEIIRIIRNLTGYKKTVGTVGKNIFRFLGLFKPLMRELVEMQYLNENPIMLNGRKYEKNIGPVPQTSYEKGLEKTIRLYDRTLK